MALPAGQYVVTYTASAASTGGLDSYISCRIWTKAGSATDDGGWISQAGTVPLTVLSGDRVTVTLTDGLSLPGNVLPAVTEYQVAVRCGDQTGAGTLVVDNGMLTAVKVATLTTLTPVQ